MARFELALEEARGEPWGHGERFVILAGGQSRCKGPGAGMCLVSSEGIRMGGAERVRARVGSGRPQAMQKSGGARQGPGSFWR